MRGARPAAATARWSVGVSGEVALAAEGARAVLRADEAVLDDAQYWATPAGLLRYR